MFDFLRDIVSRVPDYGHGHSDAAGEDRAISKRRYIRWSILVISYYHKSTLYSYLNLFTDVFILSGNHQVMNALTVMKS